MYVNRDFKQGKGGGPSCQSGTLAVCYDVAERVNETKLDKLRCSCFVWIWHPWLLSFFLKGSFAFSSQLIHRD